MCHLLISVLRKRSLLPIFTILIAVFLVPSEVQAQSITPGPTPDTNFGTTVQQNAGAIQHQWRYPVW